MEGHLITSDGTEHEVTEATLRQLIDSSSRFWLDLASLDQETAETILRGTFGFHPLAVEDAEYFGQRPKIDSYEGYALLVFYGVSPKGKLVEVHCFYTEKYLVTVHHDPCPDFSHLVHRLRQRTSPPPHTAMLLYRVMDTLVDGYFPLLEQLDDEIDTLEDEILERPTDQQLGRLFDMKRSLIAMRKVVTPQRDMMATLTSGRDLLPGMTSDAERYFRGLYDHLIRISDLVDSYRDLMSGALDTHLATVSNRLNVVMKQLTIIATIFLPLTFLTGFFGQNFAWLVTRINTLSTFLGLGIGLPLIATVALLVLFRRRGWLTPNGLSSSPQESRSKNRAEWLSLMRIQVHHHRPGDRTNPPGPVSADGRPTFDS